LDHLKFLHLHLPATNDDGLSAWYEDGYSGQRTVFPAYSALWPERYSREKLDEIKATVSSYWWHAQYMASPNLGDQTYFDLAKCPRHERLGQVDAWWVACDFANTATKGGSRTAFTALGFDGHAGMLRVLSAKAGRWRQDEMGDQLIAFVADMRRLTGISPMSVVVEQAAGGYGVIDRYRGVLPVEPLIPKGSKEERAGEVCYLVNRGSVSLPADAPWLKEFQAEVGGFPLAALADITDSFVHSLKYVVSQHEFKPMRGALAGPTYDASSGSWSGPGELGDTKALAEELIGPAFSSGGLTF
jgi:phage terminase large subunit-like protein